MEALSFYAAVIVFESALLVSLPFLFKFPLAPLFRLSQ